MLIFNFILLCRPVNIFITILSVIVAILLSDKTDFPAAIFFYAAIAAAFTAAAGNIINDYFDIEIDKINKPGRPLAAGYISKKSALIFYGLLNAAALFAAIQLNFDVFLITVYTQVLLFFYSYKLINIHLAGTLFVVYLTVSVLII